MQRIFLFFLIFVLSSGNAQEILQSYPEGQDFYEGGKRKLYADLHEILTAQKLTPCENPMDNYSAAVLVGTDAKIGFVKDFDTVRISKNRCSYDLIRTVLPHLKNWKPAEVNGAKTRAIALIDFYPVDLFDRFRVNYSDPSETFKTADYPGGINEFRQEFARNFNANIFNSKRPQKITTELRFIIEKSGDIKEFEISGSDYPEFRKEVERTIKRIVKKWKPATKNGIPIRYVFTMPISLEFHGRNNHETMNQDAGLFQKRGGF